jgi:hypothetical protein
MVLSAVDCCLTFGGSSHLFECVKENALEEKIVPG